MRERNVDLMLGRLFRPQVEDDIEVEVVGRDRFHVVAGLYSPWARRRRISLADLLGEPWILSPSDNVIGSFFVDLFHSRGLELPSRHVVTFSLDVRMHLLATGRYLTVLSDTTLKYNSERWRLKRLPIDLAMPEMPIRSSH